MEQLTAAQQAAELNKKNLFATYNHIEAEFVGHRVDRAAVYDTVGFLLSGRISSLKIAWSGSTNSASM